jgi:hypothetical protein
VVVARNLRKHDEVLDVAVILQHDMLLARLDELLVRPAAVDRDAAS